MIRSKSSAPLLLRNGHAQTLYPALFRRPPLVTTRRERISTPDGDFLDLDWNTSPPDSDHLAILSHGLEGCSTNAYVQGLAARLRQARFHILAWNFRSCSGEPNRLLPSYHSGATQDLHTVIQHALGSRNYRRIVLIGFSIGGNLTLKYLGESRPHPRITHAVTFSVPCDLESSAQQLERPENRLYMSRFLKTLRQKVREKIQRFPGQIYDHDLNKIQTFAQFDEAYTAPLHGFSSAHDYWTRSSCKPFLHDIGIPTLLLNAADDPFLAPECFPYEEAKNNPFLHLEIPHHGGHLGFVENLFPSRYFSESRTLEFLSTT